MELERNRLLSTLSTFGIGGPARYFAEARDLPRLQELIAYCFEEQIPYFILGKGSNCLFDDQGFDGLVILNKINHCQIEDMQATAGAGYSFSLLGIQTARKGLGGLEFASGIPGSVGGAVFMNAGANGKETCDALVSVTFVNEKGEIHTFLKSDLQFRYRFSSFHEMKGAIAEARFQLNLSPEARKTQLKIVDYRMQTQPYKDKSAGCIFRNPPEHSAGALIEKCGLKAVSIGGAKVSPMHANFIINAGHATAKDVLELAAHVKEKVFQETGVSLEMEVRYVPS